MNRFFPRVFKAVLALGALGIIVLCLFFFLLARLEFHPPSSRAAGLADLDGDADMDVLLANGQSEGKGYVTLWLNQGGRQGGVAATFAASDSEVEYGEFWTVALGDLDADGDPDVVAGSTGAGVILYRNVIGSQDRPGGTLERSGAGLQAGDIWAGSYPLALGDLDGDGDLDAFVGNCCGSIAFYDKDRRELLQGCATVWLNPGREGSPDQPALVDSKQRLGLGGTQGVALGDLDGDGDLDAYLANDRRTVDTNAVSAVGLPDEVWINDGKGTFSDSGQRLGSSESQSVALGDLDGDGDIDAFVGATGPDWIWLNDGRGTFADSGQRLGDARNRSIFVGDLDGDGDRDAVVDNWQAAEIWLNDGRAVFTPSSQRLKYSDRHAVAVGDLDSDGDLDIFAGYLDKTKQVWLNDGRAAFSMPSGVR